MKKIVLLLLLIVSFQAHAQWINSLSVYPSNPTVNDPVYLIANVSFPYGSCDQHTQGISQNNNTFSAWAIHCVGLLTVICGHTDTFALGTLSAGTYQASFHVDYSQAPFPCTAGITPGSNDSISFNVSIVTSTTSPIKSGETIEIYPNPARDKVYLKHCQMESEKKLFHMTGQLITAFKGMELNLTDLKPGIYFLHCEGQILRLVVN